MKHARLTNVTMVRMIDAMMMLSGLVDAWAKCGVGLEDASGRGLFGGYARCHVVWEWT